MFTLFLCSGSYGRVFLSALPEKAQSMKSERDLFVTPTGRVSVGVVLMR